MRLTYISPMPAVPTIIAPFVVGNVAFSPFTELEVLLRVPNLNYVRLFFRCVIFVQPPHRRAFLSQKHQNCAMFDYTRPTFVLWLDEEHLSHSTSRDDWKARAVLRFGQFYEILTKSKLSCRMQLTALICPFIPHVKQTLLIGQDRVECSLRSPHVRH